MKRGREKGREKKTNVENKKSTGMLMNCKNRLNMGKREKAQTGNPVWKN